jgi:hypothetical protein
MGQWAFLMLPFFGTVAAAGYPPLLAAAEPSGGISTPYYTSDVWPIGGVSVSASGGRPGYTYLWYSDNGDVFFDDAGAVSCNAFISTTFPTPYSGGIYCQVTDANGTIVQSNGIGFSLSPDV